MKKLTLALAVSALVAGSSALAQTSDTVTFSGSIPAMCTLNLNDLLAPGALDLSAGAAFQKVAGVGIWCNDGLGFADVTYTTNTPGGGHGLIGLVTGDTIQYEGRVQGIGGSVYVPPINGATVSQIAGNNMAGNHVYSDLEIRPNTNGFEAADTYTGVIDISVAPQ
ncbi:hypothetical protein CWE09_13145 [Aliidiomarina minuta]|uniref:Spore coat protein U domain-containing protein n=1 Tax=Aliidiomarina minuta TaxID=880057 RepID=A0A432W3Z7_9GAMM|nr:hypothetical protein [Aliidiomarina minuta]RUO24083.1 hypothetical protein CWE09_13145 [Aliidiomarina minuta]